MKKTAIITTIILLALGFAYFMMFVFASLFFGQPINKVALIFSALTAYSIYGLARQLK